MLRFGGGPFAPHMARGFGYGFGPGAHVLPLLWCLFVAAVIVVLIVAIVRTRRGHGHTALATAAAPVGTPADGAAAIVRERLARGEIDTEEYERLMAILNGTR